MKKNIALFAGSFDPFTRGHADIVERSLAIFDEVIIAIGINEQKRTLFSAERRQEQIARYYASRPAIGVITYSGLTVDLVRQTGAKQKQKRSGRCLPQCVQDLILSTSVLWPT